LNKLYWVQPRSTRFTVISVTVSVLLLVGMVLWERQVCESLAWYLEFFLSSGECYRGKKILNNVARDSWIDGHGLDILGIGIQPILTCGW
jgi:hypothetical protein